MLTLGIDDAGRGPVIGPMVLAGCLINEGPENELKKMGVKDSKQLTQKRREMLAEKIREKAETFEIILVHPDKIDGTEEESSVRNVAPPTRSSRSFSLSREERERISIGWCLAKSSSITSKIMRCFSK